MALQFGFLLFPGVQQLDLTGPYEVLASIPDASMHLVGRDMEPMRASTRLMLTPTATYETCPPLDIICIPGGPGINGLLADEKALQFVRGQAASARFVTSVCTGALLLGAAGLLKGKRATTHWNSIDFLPQFGAAPVRERVVYDGHTATCAGVTAGIDLALSLAAKLGGTRLAECIQLAMEYSPAPPFDAGTPETATPEVFKAVSNGLAAIYAERRLSVAAASRALGFSP